MTASTIVSKATTVTIVFGVTARTDCGHIIRRVAAMAAVATQLAVRAKKVEFCRLVVIKYPQRPGIRVVTLRTLISHRALMYVIGFVATVARGFSIMKFVVLMAALTQGNGVHAFQGKPGQFVVKVCRLVPLRWVVAQAAIFQLLFAVYAICTMATYAAARNFVIQLTLVARNAAERFMLSLQRPIGFFFVIKASFLPAITLVTTVTGLSMTPRVYIAGYVA